MQKLSFIFLLGIFLQSCSNNNQQAPGVEEDQEVSTRDKGFDSAHKLNILDKERDLTKLISQNWDYKEDLEDLQSLPHTEDLEIPFRGYYIYPDKSFVKNPRGSYETGTWTMDAEKKPVVLNLKFTNGSSSAFHLGRLGARSLVLKPTVTGEPLLNLVSEGIQYKNLKENPFHPSNNLWRKKPAANENDAEIKQRLAGCLDFFILFYDDAIYRNARTVPLMGLPSPFRWYAGGIYLQKQEKLDRNWVASFHSPQDAIKAYKLSEKLLALKYTWPKGERNWLKQNVYVLRQMRDKLEAL